METKRTTSPEVETQAAEPTPTAAPEAPGLTPAIPAGASTAKSFDELPQHSSAQVLRRATALNMQSVQGNQHVQRLVKGSAPPPVQRQDGAGGAGPGGNSNLAGGGEVAKSMVFQGKTLTNDSAALTTVLEEVATDKGLDGAKKFVSAFITHAGESWGAASQSGMTPGTGGQQGAGPGIDRPLHVDVVNLEQLVAEKLPGLLKDLEKRRDDLVSEFERSALNVISEMLNTSETELHLEAERYGVTLHGDSPGNVMGDSTNAPGAPAGGGPDISVDETQTAYDLAAAAEELRPLREKLDSLIAERDEIMGRTGQSSSAGNAGQGGAPGQSDGSGGQQGAGGGVNPADLEKLDKLNVDIGKAQVEFDELRKKKEAEFPILAAVTGPGKAEELGKMGKGAPEAAVQAGVLIDEHLKNIDKVRQGIADDDVKVWSLPTIVQGTKARLNLGEGSLGGKLIDEWAADKAMSSDLTNLAIGVIAIGLGLIAAIPTGGMSVGAAMAVGGAAVGSAGIAAWQAVTALRDYQLAQAMSGTDPDKAKVISQEDPSLFWLALDIVGAITDIKGALNVFKGISGAMRKVIISGANAKAATAAADLPELAQLKAACDAAKRPGLYERVLAQIGKAEDPAAIKAAIEQAYKAVGSEAREAAMRSMATPPPALRRMTLIMDTPETFEQGVRAADTLVKGVQGQIPDIAQKWVKEGRVRRISLQTLVADFGHLPSKKPRPPGSTFSYADDLVEDGYLNTRGFYDPDHNRCYLALGSPEEMAETLIHEAEHRLKHVAERQRNLEAGMSLEEADSAARRALNTFQAEAQAYIAQRDFLILTFRVPGGARYMQQAEYATSAMIDLMNKSDDELFAQVAADYQRFFQGNPNYSAPADITANPLVEGIFQDMASRYDAISPPPASSATRAASAADDEVTRVIPRPDDETTKVMNRPSPDDEATQVMNKPSAADDEVTQVIPDDEEITQVIPGDEEVTQVMNKP